MAAYSPYELLRVLIERVGWPTEAERVAALESVSEWESMGFLGGNLAQMTKCPHENTVSRYKGGVMCLDCKRRIE